MSRDVSGPDSAKADAPAPGHPEICWEENFTPAGAAACGPLPWTPPHPPCHPLNLLSPQRPRLIRKMAPRSHPRVSGLYPRKGMQAIILRDPEGCEP